MISKLQCITQDLREFTHDEIAEHACSGGMDWIQLRIKNKSYNEELSIAMKVKLVCDKYNAKLIVNDNVTLAKAIEADGVHLGKTDMDPIEARRILGDEFIIGGTANTFEDIQILVKANVNYIGLGPFRFTKTKENLSPILGLAGYQEIIKKCTEAGINIPIIAIGGIKTEDVKPLMETGIYGIAVSSAITRSISISRAAKGFLTELEMTNKQKANQ